MNGDCGYKKNEKKPKDVVKVYEDIIPREEMLYRIVKILAESKNIKV